MKMHTHLIRGEEVRMSEGVTMGGEQLDHTIHCSLCPTTPWPTVALRVVAGKGFCKAHMESAEKATAALGSKATGSGRMVFGVKEGL